MDDDLNSYTYITTDIIDGEVFPVDTVTGCVIPLKTLIARHNKLLEEYTDRVGYTGFDEDLEL